MVSGESMQAGSDQWGEQAEVLHASQPFARELF